MMKGPKKTVSVSMPLELYDTLKKLATEDYRSIPNYIRQVLFEHTEQKTSEPLQ